MRGNTIGNNGHKNWGTNNKMNMDNKIHKNTNKNKRANIIWFNPPIFNPSNINIGKYLLGLISKYFKDITPLEK